MAAIGEAAWTRHRAVVLARVTALMPDADGDDEMEAAPAAEAEKLNFDDAASGATSASTVHLAAAGTHAAAAWRAMPNAEAEASEQPAAAHRDPTRGSGKRR